MRKLKSILRNIIVICILLYPKMIIPSVIYNEEKLKIMSMFMNYTDKEKAERIYNAIYHNKVDVPKLLVAKVICIESGCDELARGKCGERGLMQIMPYHVQNNHNRLFELEYNIEIGSKILKKNIDMYGITGGLSVYNTGRPNNKVGELYAKKVLREGRI